MSDCELPTLEEIFKMSKRKTDRSENFNVNESAKKREKENTLGQRDESMKVSKPSHSKKATKSSKAKSQHLEATLSKNEQDETKKISTLDLLEPGKVSLL